MSHKSKLVNCEPLKSELESIQNIEDRKDLIANDLKSGVLKFQPLADQNPILFFEFLGGMVDNIDPTYSWASEYTYEDYLDDNFEKAPNDYEKNNWDLKEKSIQHAFDTGIWYETSLVKLISKDGTALFFEFDFCEGYVDEAIGHPYNTTEKVKSHGFLLEDL